MKKHGLAILMAIFGLVLFNVIAFAAPFIRGKTYWICYCFATISIILLFGAAVVCNSAGKPLQSRFYGWQIITVSAVYLIVQMVASLIFMVVTTTPPWIAIVVSSVLLCLCLMGMVSTSADNIAIQKIDDTVKTKIGFIRALEQNVTAAADHCADDVLKGKVQRLGEMIRYSDPMSHPSLATLERDIEQQCIRLNEAISGRRIEEATSVYEHIVSLLTERNQKCKSLK